MIRFLIRLYIYIIIIDAVLSYFPSVRYYNWVKLIKKVSNYVLNPIRRVLPNDLPFDISPIIAILALNMLMLLW